MIFIPYTTMQKKVWRVTFLHGILVAAGGRAELPQAIEQITGLLRQRHRLQPWQENDFSIQPLADMAAAEEESTRDDAAAGEYCLYFAAGGRHRHHEHHAGVGDRAYTRDRYSPRVGAKQKDILWQFLVEALLLSLSGGSVGIVLGLAGSQLVSGGWSGPLLVSWEAVALAFTFAGAVGIFFDFYPARKAAARSIQALRYE